MTTFNYLTLEEAESYEAKNANAFWQGWTLVIHRPNPAGFMRRNGMYRNGRWGMATFIQPNSKGLYKVRA